MDCEILSSNSSPTEARIRVIVSNAAKSCSDVDGFKRWFDSQVAKIESKNNFSASMSYECVLKGKSYAGFLVADTAEVWHKKPNGDKDRLVAKLKN